MHTVGPRGHLPATVKSFLNRKFKVVINGITNEGYMQYEGVPQASLLSTTLFTLAFSDIVYTLPVDDFVI